MFDRGPITPPALTAQAAPRLPVDRLCVGRGVADVRALLPRIFNLCRDAQAGAFDMALGTTPDPAAGAREILRDHLLKLFHTWPGLLGYGAHILPTGWEEQGAALAEAVFGPSLRAPASAKEFEAYLARPEGRVMAGISELFAPGDAVAEGLPMVDDIRIWRPDALENSVAARHAAHPVMAHIAKIWGRGPLWRAMARLCDIDAVLHGTLPATTAAGPGAAIAPAARGSYALRVTTENGLVTALTRVTPTDHLLAEGGILDLSLASLPAEKAGLGTLLLDILDPCSPVRLREVKHA